MATRTRATPPSRALRKQLANAIRARMDFLLRGGKVSMEEQAQMLGLTRARWTALKKGELDLISLDKLVDCATRLDLSVRLTVARPYSAE